jgi:Rrf2 family iron-sulfur cluster assembly transcriptional regulator
MMITTAVQNAATLLTELKNNPGMKLKDFCIKTELSKPFMEQIGLKLVRAGILHSNRGPGGGYSLKKDSITLADLMEVFDSKTKTPTNSELNQKLTNALESIEII